MEDRRVAGSQESRAQQGIRSALRESQVRLQTILDNSPAAIWIMDLEGRYVLVNNQFERWWGFAGAAPGKTDHDCFPKERADEYRANDLRVIETGQGVEFEEHVALADGLHTYLSIKLPIRGADGRVTGTCGIATDITERKRAEEALRESEEKYRTLVEQIPAVTYIDEVPDDDDPSDLTPVYISPQIETLLGYLPQEWIANPDMWNEVVHPDDFPTIDAEAHRAFAAGTQLSAEYRMIARDGRIVWIREESSLVRDEQGRPKFWQGIYIDITGLKRAEEELNNALQREMDASERLRALDDMKNTFLQAVSHELRTPLAAILGLALTLQRDEVELDESEMRDLTTRIVSNSRKLDRMVADLLDLDRLTRGIIEPKLSDTDVGALVRHLVNETDMPDGRRAIVEAEPVVLPVDASKVERIVENLLANAVRHTPVGSRVWVRIEAHAGGALITVEDEGSGVPEELHEAVFEPFRQGSAASSHSPGVGLGLALVARFAELQHGRAWVEDRPGGGASFRVFLPGAPRR